MGDAKKIIQDPEKLFARDGNGSAICEDETKGKTLGSGLLDDLFDDLSFQIFAPNYRRAGAVASSADCARRLVPIFPSTRRRVISSFVTPP